MGYINAMENLSDLESRNRRFGKTDILLLYISFCFLFRSSVLELCRTVYHCSSTVSLDSFSVVEVDGRV